ncbi:MAG: ABC transporter permease [Spirulinaceae cyanobacterium RM2_2_10]|nr:ABC transporter permease [Spirulinaceae cyanobacterium SM2_1_0]NJO19864.1 ABC transporter permease [Spirulinaceae cyanobacterium RM2_2_10]
MFHFLTKLGYLLRETGAGLRRGGWMNWAAASTMTVLLFLFGLCLQTSWQLDALMNHFGDQLEIAVYLQPDVSGDDFVQPVASLPEVKSVRVIPRDHAWADLLAELEITDIDAATAQLEGNPLVDELKVHATSVRVIPPLVAKLQGMAGVDRCVYVNEVRDRFEQIQRSVSWISLTLTAILSLTAVAVITTTLNLIVAARRVELEIMQLVGATKTWIGLPVVFQGAAFGLVGSVMALLAIAALRAIASGFLLSQPDFLDFLSEGLRLSTAQVILLPAIILGLGLCIGTAGSLFALRNISWR